MIQKSFLEKMSKEQIDFEFQELANKMVSTYNNGILFFRIAGIPPEQAIGDLFDEMKQIWLQRLVLSMKEGE